MAEGPPCATCGRYRRHVVEKKGLQVPDEVDQLDSVIIEIVFCLTVLRREFGTFEWPELGDLAQKLVVRSQEFTSGGVEESDKRDAADRNSSNLDAYSEYMHHTISEILTSAEEKKQAIVTLEQELSEYIFYAEESADASLQQFVEKLQDVLEKNIRPLAEEISNFRTSSRKNLKTLKRVGLMVVLATVADWVDRANRERMVH